MAVEFPTSVMICVSWFYLMGIPYVFGAVGSLVLLSG
jgi:hypothetical protein